MQRTLIPLLLTAALGGCASDEHYGSGEYANDYHAPYPTYDVGDAPDRPLMTDVALRDEMRQLWVDDAAWARFGMISTVADLPNAYETRERRLRNADDFGDAFRPFYGDAMADKLAAKLRRDVQDSDQVLNATIGGDPAEQIQASAKWHADARDLAAFLADANPAWDEATLAGQLNERIDLTYDEMAARISGDWKADVEAFDAVHDQANTIGDSFASAITSQHPKQIDVLGASDADRELHVAMRDLWEDHVIWTRVYILDDVARLPDTDTAAGRLLDNQDDIGNAAATYFGNDAGYQLTGLLDTHILGAVRILDAAEAGTKKSVAVATEDWYDNGHDIAAFLADANPAWDESDLEDMMDMHLDLTLDEATARLQHDAAADIAAYDAIEDEILQMADGLTDGLIEYRNGHRI
jgi:hypothetical protein